METLKSKLLNIELILVKPKIIDYSLCPICLAELDNKIILSCSHAFHEECIKRWLKIYKSCPYCRDTGENIYGFFICNICNKQEEEGLFYIISKSKCNHLFHINCIYNWIKTSTVCPTCDKKLLTEDDVCDKLEQIILNLEKPDKKFLKDMLLEIEELNISRRNLRRRIRPLLTILLDDYNDKDIFFEKFRKNFKMNFGLQRKILKIIGKDEWIEKINFI